MFAGLSLFCRGLRVRLDLKGSLVCTLGNRLLSFYDGCLGRRFVEFNFRQSCFLIISGLFQFSCGIILVLLLLSFKELDLLLLFFLNRFLKLLQLSLFGGDQQLVFWGEWDPASQLADCCFDFLLSGSGRDENLPCRCRCRGSRCRGSRCGCGDNLSSEGINLGVVIVLFVAIEVFVDPEQGKTGELEVRHYLLTGQLRKLLS